MLAVQVWRHQLQCSMLLWPPLARSLWVQLQHQSQGLEVVLRCRCSFSSQGQRKLQQECRPLCSRLFSR